MSKALFQYNLIYKSAVYLPLLETCASPTLMCTGALWGARENTNSDSMGLGQG